MNRMQQVTMNYIKEYVKRLEEVLSTRDPKLLQQFIMEHASWYDDSMVKQCKDDLDLVELIMHKSICQKPTLRDLHEDSKQWLKTHGYSDTFFGY